MIRLRDFRPMAVDPSFHWLPDKHDWWVASCGRTRDSETLERSNWEAQLNRLGGESGDVEVHLFDHWGVGWLEIVIVRPGSAAEAEAREIEESLSSYAVLDERLFSDMEHERAANYWKNASIRERLGWLRQYGVSIFAARRAELPGDTELLCALAR